MNGIENPLLVDIPSAFTGARVSLRGWQDSDSVALNAAIQESASHIGEWLPWPKYHQSPDDTRAFIRRSRAQWALGERFEMNITERATGAILGSTSLTPHQWNLPSFEIGYWLRASAEGHGYMTESVHLLLTYCFETLSAQRVMIRCDARNDRSRAIPERLGFTFEGTHRNDHRGTDGTARDSMIWAMIPDEFLAARANW